MAGIDDVAALVGVSTATVSRALSGRGRVSDATRARVVAAAASLGYVTSASASSLASGRTRNIGVLVPAIDPWFFTTVLGGIAAALMRRGYDTTLYSLPGDDALRHDVFETFLRRRRVDGIIAISIGFTDAERERLAQLGLPVVALGGADPALPTFALDDVAVARLATGHLVSLGHRDIAHIGAHADLPVSAGRRLGYDRVLAEAGIPARAERFEPADFTLEGGHRAATRLLSGTDAAPTAIFAASDEMAIGALLAARDLGLDVPGDVSVIGVDGHDLGGFFRLTTVDQFPLAQGARVADAVLDAIEGATAPVVEPLPFELVVRASTAAPGR